MKLHQQARTINVITLDGKKVKRTLFEYGNVTVSTTCGNNSTSKANAASKKYLNNPKKK